MHVVTIQVTFLTLSGPELRCYVNGLVWKHLHRGCIIVNALCF